MLLELPSDALFHMGNFCDLEGQRNLFLLSSKKMRSKINHQEVTLKLRVRFLNERKRCTFTGTFNLNAKSWRMAHGTQRKITMHTIFPIGAQRIATLLKTEMNSHIQERVPSNRYIEQTNWNFGT
eukprot:UN02683